MKTFLSENADVEGFGTLILISITIIGIGLITLVGVPSIFKMQEMANVRNAEQAFTVLDSHTSRVSLGESRMQNTDINLGGGSLSVVPNSSERSYVLIELKNNSSPVAVNSTSLDMGKIVYRLGDRELGYEGGGVWSKYLSGSVMVSPPEVHYNGMTLTLPVVNVSGNYTYGGKGRVSMSAERIRDIKIIYPRRDLTNPISRDIDKVVITIYSSYYDAWADFFKGITYASVERNASQKTVTITLNTPPVFTNFSYGALASDYIDLSNGAEIQSYNSSKGNYTVSKSGNGSIRANTWINLDNPSVTVNGSALSGGSIDVKGTIIKDAHGSPRNIVNPGKVLGNQYTAVSKIFLGSSTSVVRGKINDYNINNNNSNNPCLSGSPKTELDSGSANWSNDCTIYGGNGVNGVNYYLTKFILDTNNKEKLYLDTTLGDINIAVNIPSGNVVWKKANITVTGPFSVKIWLDGGIEAGSGQNVDINSIGNANFTSSRFQVVSSSNKEIIFEQSASFCGFVYAPIAKIYVKNRAKIFGALVGNQFSVDNSQEIYFDEALQNLNTNLGERVTIMYLHITQNDIGVSIN